MRLEYFPVATSPPKLQKLESRNLMEKGTTGWQGRGWWFRGGFILEAQNHRTLGADWREKVNCGRPQRT